MNGAKITSLAFFIEYFMDLVTIENFGFLAIKHIDIELDGVICVPMLNKSLDSAKLGVWPVALFSLRNG